MANVHATPQLVTREHLEMIQRDAQDRALRIIENVEAVFDDPEQFRPYTRILIACDMAVVVALEAVGLWNADESQGSGNSNQEADRG